MTASRRIQERNEWGNTEEVDGGQESTQLH